MSIKSDLILCGCFGVFLGTQACVKKRSSLNSIVNIPVFRVQEGLMPTRALNLDLARNKNHYATPWTLKLGEQVNINNDSQNHAH